MEQILLQLKIRGIKMNFLNIGTIIAAVRTEDDFEAALKSDADIIFDLSPDLLNIIHRVKETHEKNKKLFVHIDLASGIGKDKSGLAFVKKAGADGIISTRVNIIKIARELGMITVQRFFIVDSHSIDTTIDGVKASHPDMIELMPGIALKAIKKLKEIIDSPIIAGGLIEEKEEIEATINAGATAISTGKKELW